MSLRTLSLLTPKKPYFNAFINTPIRCSSSNGPKNENSKTIGLLKIIDDELRRKLPRVHEAAHLIKDGFWKTVEDVKKNWQLQLKVRKLSDARALSVEEMKMYFEGSAELRRITLFMLIVAMPFGNLLAIPLAIFFPYHVLTPNFWTEKQKKEFIKRDHRQRTSCYKSVIIDLSERRKEENREWNYLLAELNHGRIPSVKSLLECKRLFDTGGPYHLRKLGLVQKKNLSRLHLMAGSLLLLNRRLELWASYFVIVDRKIRDIGGARKLSPELLRSFCYMRGINSNAMTDRELCAWLDQWTEISPHVKQSNCSLILYAPAILTANHPSNHPYLNHLTSQP